MSKLRWFTFWDSHSGGGLKTKWEKIYVEAASRDSAIAIFTDKTGQDPTLTACDCCGQNYSIYENETLEGASDFHRSHWPRWIAKSATVMPLDEYVGKESVLVLNSSEGAK